MQKNILLSSLTFILSIHLYGQISRPADLGTKIITSLQTENFGTYKSPLLDSADFVELHDDFVKSNSVKIKAHCWRKRLSRLAES